MSHFVCEIEISSSGYEWSKIMFIGGFVYLGRANSDRKPEDLWAARVYLITLTPSEIFY